MKTLYLHTARMVRHAVADINAYLTAGDPSQPMNWQISQPLDIPYVEHVFCNTYNTKVAYTSTHSSDNCRYNRLSITKFGSEKQSISLYCATTPSGKLYAPTLHISGDEPIVLRRPYLPPSDRESIRWVEYTLTRLA